MSPSQGSFEGHLTFGLQCSLGWPGEARAFHVLVRTDSISVVAYINHQCGLRSRPLGKLVQQILLWAETRLLSLRAIFVPGLMNREADFLLRQVLRPGEWRLHPQVVESIWRIYGWAEVDLFTSEESTHCPLWYSVSPRGLDALVRTWPRLRLYAFPLVALLPQVLARRGPPPSSGSPLASSIWFADHVSLLDGTPWEIPIREDSPPLPKDVEALGLAPEGDRFLEAGL
ncbi:hypothetical protein QTP70_012724 [Hemibagrus guttatus]|uniref:Uncharacterized protein n=1 Tax=Hemibagrus guttatus TaxID=175788 RepID=A0AAE0RG65_9TELE|nr:hypothetical protein QTP70_012724 [Hemibagrus guttatus]